ncbi:hypothetical protein Tfer_2743 [Thermincola ferriacetica]|uniref:NurA domain-containing protein n=2 Tax=Thermincola ferriacetica TaxID=281456 RepID=A0A0L6VZ97_9FIRM|nr:hypothetical protein Tfer_2743 [Thermincola ferriacetica]
MVLLDTLRREISVLNGEVRRIVPRNSTSISLVGTDGGNNKLKFDPFFVQVIRVVDSSNNEYYMDVITPTTKVEELNRRIFEDNESKLNSLKKMMEYLGVDNITKLSPMIKYNSPDKPISPSWVQVYRELVEWATLFAVVREKDFGTDTLILFDGLLRSKVFAGDLFAKYRRGLEEGIQKQFERNRRRIYIAGLAKHSKVLERYRLAMHIENIMTVNYPCYVEIPRSIEEKAYVWSEYARGDDIISEGTEVNKFVAGKMFFVKFGSGKQDPVWAVDILLSQAREAQQIIGCLLADAVNGFPIPFYPLSLQKAHENAALIDFDMNIIQDEILNALRISLGPDSDKIDIFRFVDTDPSINRY